MRRGEGFVWRRSDPCAILMAYLPATLIDSEAPHHPVRRTMADPRLIGPQAATTPPAFRHSAARRPELPPDLLRDASRRLGVVALIGAALWISAPAGLHWALRRAASPVTASQLQVVDRIAAGAVLVSLGLFAYTRWRATRPQRALDVGLVYLVLTNLAIGATFHWGPMGSAGPVLPTISWAGPVILIFAALTPSTPVKTVAACFVAASMMPASMLIARARGHWGGAVSDAFLMHYPDYLIAAVAAVIALTVTRLGQQLAKAREMGSYQLGDLLGAGGMGEVYHATHRMLARPAAIKLIRPEALGADGEAGTRLAVTRFRREATTAASLRSPHTVELYDFGVTEDQTMYFVMELLEGMNLDLLVRAHGPMPPNRVVHILRQVCESLAEAHARGLVHRDIKPANIHVGRLGLRHDFVKVLDFGLVKSVTDHGDGDGDATGATAAGLTPGTPAYMSPEAALGEPLDGRADLYALGCVAYWLLTGTPVVEAATSVQMIAKHMRSEPAPPSARAPLEMPPALDRLVLACLAKKAADRPASAAAMSRMLDAIEVEPWTEEMARIWWEAHAPTEDARA